MECALAATSAVALYSHWHCIRIGEPRELDMEPGLQIGPDLSKTIHLPSKEPRAMP